MYLGISLAEIFGGGGLAGSLPIFGYLAANPPPSPLSSLPPPPPMGYLPLLAISRPHKALHILQHLINFVWKRLMQALNIDLGTEFNTVLNIL